MWEIIFKLVGDSMFCGSIGRLIVAALDSFSSHTDACLHTADRGSCINSAEGESEGRRKRGRD